MKSLCNSKCNECEAIENKQVALLLNVLALKFGSEVWHITNKICPNLTCCPICRVDDFCHSVMCGADDEVIASIDNIANNDVSCEVADAAIDFYQNYTKQNKGK